MSHITLFTDILPEEQERMRVCFQARELVFKNGEIVMEYSSTMHKIGLILYGRATLYCCDKDGNQYMIDELKKDAVFGEPFLLSADSQHYYVKAEEETKVMFIDYEHVIKRCEKACHHHSQMISNLLQMTALQSRQQMQKDLYFVQSYYKEKAACVSEWTFCGKTQLQNTYSNVLYSIGSISWGGQKCYDKGIKKPGRGWNRGKRRQR